MQQVLLAPEEPELLRPLPRVLVRDEDVVHVHDHARLQARQDLQHDVVDVAAELHDVRRVDEEDVAALQLVEDGERDVLRGDAVQAVEAGQVGGRDAGERVVGVDPAGVTLGGVLARGLRGHQRRVAGAELDDALGLVRADDAVQRRGVEQRVRGVLRRVAIRGERDDDALEPLELGVEVPVDAGEPDLAVERVRRQRREVRDRRVEGLEDHLEAEARGHRPQRAVGADGRRALVEAPGPEEGAEVHEGGEASGARTDPSARVTRRLRPLPRTPSSP